MKPFAKFLAGFGLGLLAGLALMWAGLRDRQQSPAVSIAPASASKTEATARSAAGPLREVVTPILENQREIRPALTGFFPVEPEVREAERQAQVESLTKLWLDDNLAAYERLYASLGVSPAEAQKLLEAVGEVARLKYAAHAAFGAMTEAMNSYDRAAAATMGSSFAAYRQYEAERPAQREIVEIQRYAEANRLEPIPEGEIAAMTELLTQARAFSRPTQSMTLGPYWPPALPRQGYMVAAHLRDMNNLLAAQSGNLVEAAGGRLSAGTIELLRAHYANQRARSEENIGRVEEGFRQTVYERAATSPPR